MNRMSYTLLFLISIPAFGDQVTMKNGDRLSGAIVKYDGKNLVIKSELAGPVTIPWDAVTVVTSSTPLSVGLKDGQVVVGTVTTADATLQIVTASAGTVSAARESVTYIRSKEEQEAYLAEVERYRNPRLIDLWTGGLDMGYATSRGNSSTDTFTLGASAVRATSRDKISVNYTSIFAGNKTVGGRRVTTANAKRGGVSYDLNLSSRTFAFGSVDLETDEFQNLDLRFVPAGGLGYHARKSERTILDFRLGAAANREFFSNGLNRTSAEVLLGEEFMHKFSARSRFLQKLVFFPNVSDGGNYRMNFDASLATAVRRWFSFQFSVSDRYLSNPLPGRKSNDVLFTTGLRLTFAK